MQEATKDKLVYFCQNNNWSSAHPLDMDRFWDFVSVAYRNNDRQIDKQEFVDILKAYCSGLDEEKQSDWYGKYQNGIDLLEIYNKN